MLPKKSMVLSLLLTPTCRFACALERLLFGPAHASDGSENLIGALRQSMAAVGASNIGEMQAVEMVYAPAVATEGKSWQRRR